MADKRSRLQIPETCVTFGEALHWARTERKMTLRQLGDALKLTAAYLCDLEHDRRTAADPGPFETALHVRHGELERRSGVTESLRDWLARNPKLVNLLYDMRARRVQWPLVLKGPL